MGRAYRPRVGACDSAYLAPDRERITGNTEVIHPGVYALLVHWRPKYKEPRGSLFRDLLRGLKFRTAITGYSGLLACPFAGLVGEARLPRDIQRC